MSQIAETRERFVTTFAFYWFSMDLPHMIIEDSFCQTQLLTLFTCNPIIFSMLLHMFFKNVKMLNTSWEPGNVEMLIFWNAILGTCLATFVFMSMLKTQCLLVNMAIVFLDLLHFTDNTNHRAGSQLKIITSLSLIT